MTGLFLTGCILFPLLLLALSLGAGLLVDRVAAGGLPGVLIVPVGFALLVSIAAFATYVSWLAPAAGAIMVAFALAGFALAARSGTLRIPRVTGVPWAGLAALGAFVAVAGPALLSGTATWSGYSRIVDIGFQLDFAKHLADAARATVGNDSSYNVVVQKMNNIGYPGGGQATLGAVARMIHTDVPWCYQAYHGFAAAVGALSIYSLLGRVTRNAPLRAVGGFIAIQPNLLYAYALEGGIKELTTASLLMTAVAVLAERLPGEASPRTLLPLAVSISAAFGAFSLGVAPWLGVLLGGALLVTQGRPNRLQVLGGWAALATVTVLITLPGIISAATQLSGIAGSAVGGTVDLGLGNLAAPVPKWSAAGVWLTGDYRFPLMHVAVTHALDVFVIVCAAVGLLYGLVRRHWALVAAGVAAPVALYYYVEHSTAWLQFKAFTLTGVFALTLAFAGAAALLGRGRRFSWLAWPVVGVLSAGVLYGNAIVYHDTTLAPAARYSDLAAIGKRYAGQGPALFPAFDEYAEYFLRREHATSSVNPAKGEFSIRPGVPEPGGIGFAFNLNQFELPYLQKFALVIEPRNPLGVRAPSNWVLAQQTRYFNVWRRERPAGDVYAHFPLSGLAHERNATFCRDLATLLGRAGHGAKVAFVASPQVVPVPPASGIHPDYWKPQGSALVLYGAGSDRISFALPRAGSYTLWVAGTIGRPVSFILDGHSVGTVAYEERYPGQLLRIGARSIGAGVHMLTAKRGGGSLHPGSGDDVDPDARILGPILLAPAGAEAARVQVAPAAAAARICSAPVGYEWIEVLRPGAVSA